MNAALEIARIQGAIPMWAAVRVDALRQRFDIYLGSVIDLPDKRYIPMAPGDWLRHLTLAKDEFDSRISCLWSNVRRGSSGSASPEFKPIQKRDLPRDFPAIVAEAVAEVLRRRGL